MITLNKNYYSAGSTRYVFIDGATCANMDDVYYALSKQLSLPEYFGNNLDALDEVLADLEWIDEGFVLFIVLNAKSFIEKNMNGFLEVLKDCDNDKLEIVILDGE
jgi:RNAse (barnase) inhibitor barstar